jgi:hypothetical protein
MIQIKAIHIEEFRGIRRFEHAGSRAAFDGPADQHDRAVIAQQGQRFWMVKNTPRVSVL